MEGGADGDRCVGSKQSGCEQAQLAASKGMPAERPVLLLWRFVGGRAECLSVRETDGVAVVVVVE